MKKTCKIMLIILVILLIALLFAYFVLKDVTKNMDSAVNQNDDIDIHDDEIVTDNMTPPAIKFFESNVSDDYALIFDSDAEKLRLFDIYRGTIGESGNLISTDGMLPYNYKRYIDDNRKIIVGTALFDELTPEYINYLRMDSDAAKTTRGITVGDSEVDLLKAYPDDLYYIGGDETEAYTMEGEEYAEPDITCDYAYAFQVFTTQNNECRDITFYIENGVVKTIEIVSPYELRYVYGFDREESKSIVDEKRRAQL